MSDLWSCLTREHSLASQYWQRPHILAHDVRITDTYHSNFWSQPASEEGFRATFNSYAFIYQRTPEFPIVYPALPQPKMSWYDMFKNADDLPNKQMNTP